MINLLRKNYLLLAWGILTVALNFGCSSKPSFKPEVGGPGAKSSKGGVVYSVPPTNTVLKMKLISSGISKDTLLVRMLFLRVGARAGEFLNPREQSILLPDTEDPIYPSKVHANAAGKPMIRLADAKKQTVELMFPLPSGGHQYPFIKLNWKLHYTLNGEEKVMAETERFDLNEHEEPQKSVGEYDSYGDLPYVGYGAIPADWITPGWMWW